MKRTVLYILFILAFSMGANAQGSLKKRIKLSPLPVRLQLEKSGIYHFAIDSAYSLHNTCYIYINRKFGFQPIRDTLITKVMEAVKTSYRKQIGRREVVLMMQNRPLESYIPHFISQQVDSLSVCRIYTSPIVRRIERSRIYAGLNNRKIALWASHGCYYNMSDSMWIWQRSRLFGTVEDLFSTSFVNAYLCPMLENAGAEVFMPRERDRQHRMVVVDNDNRRHQQFRRKGEWEKVEQGYRQKTEVRDSDNLFVDGSYLATRVSDLGAYVEYTPTIEERGRYAVYVSWGAADANNAKAYYTVAHLGGETHFEVDQRVDGRMWYYLGTFEFAEGRNRLSGSVRVEASTDNAQDALLTTDAVRFGGGMGRVVRGEGEAARVSGAPAFHEGARYYLQASGMPDSVYSPEAFVDDYRDDFRCRGLWVNHLINNMQVPLDLSFAFHTDSGISADSTVIGTLTIFNTDYCRETEFPDGSSRLMCRELSEMVQTQLVEDIRRMVDTAWIRREMWDKPYNEVYKPDIPALIVELLSHQNLSDMRSGLDPRFRFIASRAIYKALLRYLSQYSTQPYIVQPLPPQAFQIERVHGKKVRLSWLPQVDLLESTAVPLSYRLYRREGDGAYNNGVLVRGNSCVIDLPEWGKDYHFRVTAENGGGESFPSEELSVCLFEDARPPVLIVNGFTRVSAPLFWADDSMGGIDYRDEGVADGYNLHTVGRQYEYDRCARWCDNENPGWGATDSSARGYEERGNTFDYVSMHGRALQSCGLSYVSCSRWSFETRVDVDDYRAIDLLMGEQRTVDNLRNETGSFAVFTPALLNRLQSVRVPVFMSGAYVGTDISQDLLTSQQVAETLHYMWVGDSASRTSQILSSDAAFHTDFSVCTDPADPFTYRVESPDAIAPADGWSRSIYRYEDTNQSAGVAFDDGLNRMVIFGFPFEAILHAEQQRTVMRQVMQFLLGNEL